MTVVSSKYRGSTKYLLIYGELLNAARYRGHITYQEVAAVMGLPLQGNHMQKEVGHILGEISEDEVQHGRPMLSALAVSTSGPPSFGFFGLAKELGQLQDDSEEGRQRFWQATRGAVYETWRKELASKKRTDAMYPRNSGPKLE